MILETATVVTIESDSLWVDTVQKSTCETCVAEKGCGTRTLSKLMGKSNQVRVVAEPHQLQQLTVGQQITIAIPEDVVVGASLLVYLLPLLCSLLGLALLGSGGDTSALLGAALGLLLGAFAVNRYSLTLRDNPRLNPVLYKDPGDRLRVELS
ncbi:MAG: SoxR reducing system RseC family protein [Porticoccaceae bacterium]|jgi:sigma-E factor negative regulatory protein RseC